MEIPPYAEADAQLAIAREVAERRRDALSRLAMADRIMDEDREILQALSKR